uniref:Uncharacterized protein n=1 Tax=Anguilla anguilla TaxID=7936 RepID=A0A0E9RYV0_ANGAN
MPLLMFAMK